MQNSPLSLFLHQFQINKHRPEQHYGLLMSLELPDGMHGGNITSLTSD
jgi:hypothetical protein